MYYETEIKKIPIEEVVAYFQSEGMEITNEEAESIMEFLYTLTIIVVQKYINNNQ